MAPRGPQSAHPATARTTSFPRPIHDPPSTRPTWSRPADSAIPAPTPTSPRARSTSIPGSGRSSRFRRQGGRLGAQALHPDDHLGDRLHGSAQPHDLCAQADRPQKAGGHHANGPRVVVRMTKNQRIQHFLLFVSFFTLVITGFALKFPDAATRLPLCQRNRYAATSTVPPALLMIAGQPLPRLLPRFLPPRDAGC